MRTLGETMCFIGAPLGTEYQQVLGEGRPRDGMTGRNMMVTMAGSTSGTKSVPKVSQRHPKMRF
jgi:hypothetical protein